MTITLQRILYHFFDAKGTYHNGDDYVINAAFSELSYQGNAIAVLKGMGPEYSILGVSTRGCDNRATLTRLNAIIKRFYDSNCSPYEPVRKNNIDGGFTLFGKPWNGLWAQMKGHKPNTWRYVK